MNVKKTVLRLGIIITTGLALALGGFAPSAQAAVYFSGDQDCGLTVNRTVTAWSAGANMASIQVNAMSQTLNGVRGPYRVTVNSPYVHAPWVAAADPLFIDRGAACTY